MNTVRVLVVDGSTLHRNNIVRALETLDAVEVVGNAPTGALGLNRFEILDPDIVILDASLPDMEGLALFSQMEESKPGFAVVMTTDDGAKSDDITMRALDCGVIDFISKPAIAEVEDQFETLRADLGRVLDVCRTQQGLDSGLGPAVARKMSENIADLADRKPEPATGAKSSTLTDEIYSRIEIVAIGVSTGGPKALSHLIPLLPASLRVPVAIVQHMPRHFTKTLTDSLAERSAVPVKEGCDKQILEPGTVYLAPGGRQMKVVNDGARRRLVLTDDPPENHCRPAVDYLFRSVAHCCGAHALGVIMTGMGADGCVGLSLMKARGARVIAQDEASSLVFGMPNEAIKAGLVDEVVSLDEMADSILRYVGDA